MKSDLRGLFSSFPVSFKIPGPFSISSVSFQELSLAWYPGAFHSDAENVRIRFVVVNRRPAQPQSSSSQAVGTRR